MRTRLGHYDIVAELGRGGMGVVYKGYEASLNRYVAIKVLADSLAHDEAIKERFLREARSMAALNDPHIIQIYFIGEDEGQTYFVMEFVEGESLGSMLKRDHRLTVEQAAKVIQQTAQGLATAHDRGVVHRDIKPGNLMISSRGAVKIADFGIALSNQDISKKLTSTGEFVGTPGYLSPEVCLGKPVDQRSDIFSLGIVLFEMLAGRMPFTDESPLGLMLEVVRAEIPDVRELNNEVDEKISWILSKMIAKEPDDRYQSCHELAADLAEHPLVAKSGPITIVPKMSAAAATMIGQRTPVSAQRPLSAAAAVPGAPMANTRITPSAQPMPPAYQGTAPTAPGVAPAFERQSVLERPVRAPRRSAALPIAIAALLVLGLVGGAWAFRDRLGFGTTTTASVATPPVQTASTPTPANSDATALTAATAPAMPPPSTPVNDAQAVASTVPASVDANAQPAATASELPATTTQAIADGPGPRASQADVEALRDLPAARAAEADSPQIAVATPPKKPAAPSPPREPTIAVVAAGDDVIADPARDAVVNLLQRRGFRVIEANLGGGSAPNVRSLRGRADAVVFVHAKPVGSQVLTYYGQASTLYTVQMGVKAFRVTDGSTLWSSGMEQVNFTTLNASEKAREAVDPMLDAVDRNLDEFRPRRGRG